MAPKRFVIDDAANVRRLIQVALPDPDLEGPCFSRGRDVLEGLKTRKREKGR